MTVTATDSDQPAQTLSFSIVGGADAAKFAINANTGALSFLAAPDFETPTDAGGDNVYDVTVQVSDGRGSTDSQAIAVTVTAGNDNAPVITSGATASVAENTTAVMTVTATDADQPAQTLSYSIIGGADAAKFTINASTGTLSFISAPDFETPTDASGDNIYDVTVQVSDGQGGTNSQAIAVTVTSANDNAPVITSAASASVAENTTAVMTVTATDADQPAQTLSYSIVGGADAAKFAINSSTGALSFISAPDFESPTDAGGDNVYDVTVQVSDGQGSTDSQAIAVTVTAGNDNAPVITSGATASVAENTTAVMTVTATDADQPAQTLSFSIIGGADAAKFAINSSTGALSFLAAPDFETPTDAGGDNVYDVTIQVSDGQGGTDSLAIAVTVTAGNDNAPVITSGATASVAENTTAVMTVTATDADQPAQTLSYSIIGGVDAAKFAINSSTGALSFLAAPDFETPTDAGGDNVYDVTIQVSDGQGGTDSQAIAVTVTAGNDNAPVITSGATASVAENTTAVMTVTATDSDQPAQTLSFSIVGGADAAKFAINASTGALSFLAAPDFETPTDAGGDNVYDVTVQVSDGQGSTDSQAIAVTVTAGNDNAPVITSGATASVAENTTAVMTVTATDSDQPAQTLSYSIIGGADAAKFAINANTGALSFLAAPDFETPTDAGGDNVYDVTVEVADGQGGTDSQAIAVTVIAGNDNAPTITSGATASVAENTTAVMTVTATDSDQPAQTLSFSIVGGADAAKFAINANTGALSFLAAPDFETPTDAGGDNVYDVTIQVSDGQGSTDSQAIAVTVTSANDSAPVITSSATASVAENTTAVMTMTATDADQPAQTLSYSIIGGADATKFAINSSTGALSFVSAPDFEVPTDAGGDNVYDVTVQVSDDQGSTDSQAIAVTVTAGNDNAPVITSAASASVAENTTAVMTVTATDADQPAQTLSYSIVGGADAAKFAINSSTGALSFISAPDFESPTDAGGDNVYDVTVQVSDGQGSTDSQAIAVTVTAGNDNAPVITSGATASVAENTTAVMTVTATDVDLPAQTLTYSIVGGADAAKFAIHSSTGALSFLAAPDFETPTDAGGDNVYDVTIQVSDGQGGTDSQAIAVTVTAGNDNAPVITSAASASVAENTTAVMTVTATDADQPAQTLSYSIIGGADAAKFAINSSTGALSFLAAPDFETPTDAGGDNVYDVTVQVSDGQGSTDSQAIAVTVTSANDNAPVITSGATASVAENTTAVMTVTATDSDQPAQTLSYSIVGGADAAKFAINSSTGALSFISAPDFETPTDAGGNNVYDVTVQVSDGQGSTNSLAIAVTVTAGNDNAPVITSGATASVAENTTAVMTVTATDSDQPAQTLSFSIVGGADAAKFAINSSTGALSFISAPDFETPTDAGGDNVYDVTVQVSDGQGSTDSQAIAVTVTSANDNAPVITSGATASVAENTTAVMTVTATDADQPAQTLSFSIIGGADAAKFAINASTGALSFVSAPDFESPTDAGGDNVYDVTVQVADGQGSTDSQAIAVTVTSANDNAPVITSAASASVAENTTAVMTVTATDSDQPAQALSFSIVGGADAAKFAINASTGALSFLTTPDYETPTDAGGNNVYDVTVQVSDGQGSTDSQAIAVTVTAGNDNAPVITSGATASVAENTTAVMTVTATDADLPAQTLTYSIVGGADAAKFAINSSTGALSFVSAPDFESPTDAGGDNVYDVTVQVSDGQGSTNSQAIAVTVTSANDNAPVITSGATASVAENTTAVMTVTATDADQPAQTLSYSIIGGADAAKFAINASTGALSFLTAPDFETPTDAGGDNVYDVTVQVSDGQGSTDSQAIAVTVTAGNDNAPVITSGATASVAENTTAVMTVAATDADQPAQTLSYSIVGGADAAKFAINASTGALSFLAAPDFETPTDAGGDNVYNVIVQVSDGQGGTDSQAIAVTVTAGNDNAPVITSGATASVAENTTAVMTVTATDSDQPAQTLSYSIIGGADAAKFAINAGTGALSFISAPDFESPTDAGGDNVYDVTIQVSDGQGSTDSLAIAVTVTAGNDNAPVITSGATASVAENTTAVMTVTATDADLPAQTLTYSIVGGADAAKFAINSSTGALSFVSAPDFESPTDAGGDNVYDVTVQVSDGQGSTNSQAIAVTVTSANDNAPVITSGATASVAENTTAVMTVTATDADLPAQTLTYSIVGGADAAKFAINSSTGALSFISAPDFESPTDAGGDNVYDVTVEVSDGQGGTDSQAIAVTVTAGNDNAPVITSGATASVAENTTAVMTVTATDSDQPAQTLSYSIIGGADAAKFAINANTGALSFLAAPDFETPTDAGGDNVYDVTVEVADGQGSTDSQAIAVTVTSANDNAPVITSGATASVAENTTAVMTVTATDTDQPAQSLSFSIIGGADAAKFTINASTGALSFLAAPDFETPTDAGGDNVYDVTVQVADGQGSTDSQAIAVTVTAGNDNAPVITSGATASVAENTTAVMTVTATDSDQPAQTLSYSIIGGADAAKFAINAGTGALSFISAPDFESPTDAGGDNVYDVTVQVSDGQGSTNSQAIAVTVTSANDNAPVITSAASASVAENTTAVMTVTATDSDQPAQALSFSIVGGADAAKFAINASTGALSFLTTPDYETPTDAGGNNVYDVTVQVSDGQGSTDSQAIAVTVTSANDNAPVITSGATASVAENTTAVMTVAATDSDQPAQTLSFSIVGGADAAKFAINANTGALSFLAAPDFETPTDAGGDNVYDVTVQVSDGQGSTDSQAIAVTVTSANDNAPVITSGATASVAENTTAVMTVTATDSDQPAQTLSYSIVGGADAAKFTINASTGALSFVSAPDFETPTDAGGDNVYDVTVEVSDGQGGTDSQAIAVTVTAGNDNAPVITSGATASVAENTTAVMTVTATDSDQPAQTLSYSIVGGADAAKFAINASTGALSFISAPDFETPTDAGGDNVYDVTVQVADGQGSTDSLAIAVTVTAGNDNAPVITSGATASVAENTTAVMTVTATDTDQPAQSLSFSIIGGADAAKFTINAGTGALSFVSAPDFESPTDAGGDNVYDVTVQVSDGQGSTNSQAIAVTVTSANDNAPLITSGATANVAENTTAVMTVTATDADQPAQTLSFSIVGGADAGKFTINSSTGALSFLTAPDFETPTDAGGNNVYDVTVQVSDGQGSTDSQAIAVTVISTNDNAPTITSGATASVAENTTAVMTVTATDSDQPAQTLSFSIVGGADAAKFAINANTGALSFLAAPDFETPTDAGGDNVYDVTVQVADGQGSTDSLAIAVTVTAGNDNAPVITSGATASIAENTTAVMTVTATDADQPAQTLSYSIVGGADAAKFTINAGTGALSFVSAPDFETPTDAGGDNVYDVTVEVSDGQGSTDSQAIAVTVISANDNAPVITSGATASVAENTTAVMTVTATDADQPAQTLSFSIAGGADAAKFAINASTGALSFISAPDFETPTDAGGDNVYDVTVQVSDGQGSTDSQAIAVTVTSANDNAPVITSGATASVAENTTAVMTVTATDTDQPAQSLSFSIIGGADAAKFTINASTGALSFVSAPDFETPTDAGGDNVYDVTVEVADGQGSTDSLAIAVTVTAGNDNAPVITSGATASVAENTTAVMTVTATDSDQPAQTLSFSIVGGADAAKFAINASTGALSFLAAPDFEAPTDAGGDNVYDVTVQVSDGQGSTDSQAIAVTVTSGNDNAPVITSGATASVAENTTAVMTVTATDADQPAQTLSYSIVGGADAAKFAINASTGALSFLTAPDFETPTDAGGDNVYDVTVQVSDGQGSTDSQAIAVTVTAGNDNAPVITSGATASVAENTTAVMTVAATDADQPAQTLSYSIVGGADAAKFAINAGTGALSFISAPDFESPTDAGGDNVYDVTIQVSDGQGSTDSLAIAVTVTAGNDNAPVITSGTTASIAENTTAVMTVTATDSDQPAQTLSFSITGGADAARFAIDAVSGALRFVSPPDFEQSSDADGDNVYEVVVSVSDGTLDTATSLTISVIGLSEAPHGSDGSIRLNEDESYVFSTADFGFSDPGDNHADLLAAVQIVGLPARGMLSLDGRSVTDGEWVAAVDIASGLLRYVPPADENGLPFTSLGFRVRDDGGTANGGADTEAGTHVLTIGVNPLSDAPIGKNDSYVLDEDGFIQLENGGVLANDTDPDGLPLSAELVSGPANGQLTLESNGSFRFTPDADWNGVDGFSYRPSNGQEVGDIVRVTLTVTPVNDAPTLVKASFPLAAGGAVTLGADAIQATDKDSPQSALVYEVVRTENGHFELTSAPGKAVSAFSHADLLAGRVVFHHQAFADRPVVVLRAGDGQSMGPELEASVAFSPAGSISTSPLPSYETQPDSGVANPSQGTTGAVKPPARPAAPSTLAPLQVFPEVAEAGGDGHSLHLTDGVKTEAVARRSSLESQARFSRAQITLTLGTQPDGALMEFMLGAQDPARADTGSTASRAVSDRSKTAPLSEPYADVQLVLHAVELSGIVLTAGAVWWASRASGLIAGLLMVAPAWRTFDPLPVLGPVDDSEKDWGRRMDDEMTRDEIGVADLFDQEREGWVR
jgi:hypothetical protein